MTAVKVSEHFGIVVRKSALDAQAISTVQLLATMETTQPLDENQNLISFGPHFGREACNEFIRRLEQLGLTYGDDFIDIEETLPSWCQLYVELSK